MDSPKRILPIIVLSQFFCTSLWFAGNAVLPDLLKSSSEQDIGSISLAVQLGFISGTLLFALSGISDRFRPTGVFLFCAALASLINLFTLWLPDLTGLLFVRFATGFFLAGIYPVGMKIASDHFKGGLGRSLGYLVGALVLGTALPHLLKSFSQNLDWQPVIYGTSILSFSGGLLIFLFVPEGPFRNQFGRFNLAALVKNLRIPEFRSAAFGYFGHMWELYAFWAFVPFILQKFNEDHGWDFDQSLWSFAIIGIGSPACVAAGYVAQKFGAQRSSAWFLGMSGLCCLLAPVVFQISSQPFLLSFLLFWGMVVVADSPLFSTLIASSALGESRGSALTAVTCIGFAVTLISIRLIAWMAGHRDAPWILVFLALGPAIGVWSLIRPKSN